VWTILIDIIAWFGIHIAVVYTMLRIPGVFFRHSGWLYRERQWEKEGRLYQHVFKIKRWKKYLPDGAGLFKDRGFPKKHLQKRHIEYLSAFRRETCRAELTHWVMILVAPSFFLWNLFFVGVIMIIYAAAENIPLIMTQRYNRHRLSRVLESKRALSDNGL